MWPGPLRLSASFPQTKCYSILKSLNQAFVTILPWYHCGEIDTSKDRFFWQTSNCQQRVVFRQRRLKSSSKESQIHQVANCVQSWLGGLDTGGSNSPSLALFPPAGQPFVFPIGWSCHKVNPEQLQIIWGASLGSNGYHTLVFISIFYGVHLHLLRGDLCCSWFPRLKAACKMAGQESTISHGDWGLANTHWMWNICSQTVVIKQRPIHNIIHCPIFVYYLALPAEFENEGIFLLCMITSSDLNEMHTIWLKLGWTINHLKKFTFPGCKGSIRVNGCTFLKFPDFWDIWVYQYGLIGKLWYSPTLHWKELEMIQASD